MNAPLSTSRGLLPWMSQGSFPTLRDEMEHLFQRFWDENGDPWNGASLAVPVDMKESDTEVTVRLDVPGVAAKDVDVRMHGNQLVISGQRSEEKEDKGETYHRVERRSGRFSRTMTMPCEVLEEKIDASLKDGILTVVLPKSPQSQSRPIEVKCN